MRSTRRIYHSKLWLFFVTSTHSLAGAGSLAVHGAAVRAVPQ